MMGTKRRVFFTLPRDVSLEDLVPYRGTEPHEKALRKRRVWVEPLFAEAKAWHGMGRFRLRRLERVNAEVLLVAAGQNLKRLLAHEDRGPRSSGAALLRPPRPITAGGRRLQRCRLSTHRRVPPTFCNSQTSYRNPP